MCPPGNLKFFYSQAKTGRFLDSKFEKLRFVLTETKLVFEDDVGSE